MNYTTELTRRPDLVALYNAVIRDVEGLPAQEAADKLAAVFSVFTWEFSNLTLN